LAIKETIRTANCNSLINGQRVPSVVRWYEDQHTCYADASAVLRTGQLFMLHYLNKSDMSVELIPVWLQEADSCLGLVFRCNHVTLTTKTCPKLTGPDPLASETAARNKIQFHNVLYQDITTIMTGSKTEVYHTAEMGGQNR
jgi:hypothetical protein